MNNAVNNFAETSYKLLQSQKRCPLRFRVLEASATSVITALISFIQTGVQWTVWFNVQGINI